MTTNIRIPELGEGVDKVDVVAVLVKVGDAIEVDQPLIEVETEKAAVEIPATIAGTITEIHVEVGQTLGPDAPIVTIDADESESVAESKPASQPESAAGSGAEIETETDDSGSGSDKGSNQRQEQPQKSAPEAASGIAPEIQNSKF